MDIFSINEIYDHNINFLIGSGASVGIFPTLALKLKDDDGDPFTIETLATELGIDDSRYDALFMYYYLECIKPAMDFDISIAKKDAVKNTVISNYEIFLTTLLTVLQRRKNGERSCNIFTTNYDGCFAHVADDMLQHGATEFIINDGSRGFSKRYLHAKNFNSFTYQSGIFNQHLTDIPQINLIHLHGSVYWYKDGENIRVDYSNNNSERKIDGDYFNKIDEVSELLSDDSKVFDDLPDDVELTDDDKSIFWGGYNKLPIVNPTKWKFNETLFEEHYYQMLRLLSYELEKPNSIFIIFGFSFSDEHILNLIRRSLSNPSLQVFVCCYSAAEYARMEMLFKTNNNVKNIFIDEPLDFSAFNEKIFNLNPTNNDRNQPQVEV